MIRVCTINDKEILEKYLQEEPYAGAILAAIEEFGFDEKFQTVYLDSEKRNLDTEGDGCAGLCCGKEGQCKYRKLAFDGLSF